MTKAEPDDGRTRATASDEDQLRCVVVTPERSLIDQRVDFVALPLFDGELGVLPGRAPLIGRLGYGELRTKVKEETTRYFVDGGFVQVRDDVVTVLTRRAVLAHDVDRQGAADALQRALAQVATSDAQYVEKERDLARARAQLRIAGGPGV